MDNICKIKDDDEILQDELNRYNFRRFTPEEIQKKYSPFERISKKKEINFLFQKKKYSPKLEGKVSLEDLLSKIENLDLSGNSFSPHTPTFSPFSRGSSPVPELNLDKPVLKENDKMEVDG
jgi:hypothetical protein